MLCLFRKYDIGRGDVRLSSSSRQPNRHTHIRPDTNANKVTFNTSAVADERRKQPRKPADGSGNETKSADLDLRRVRGEADSGRRKGAAAIDSSCGRRRKEEKAEAAAVNFGDDEFFNQQQRHATHNKIGIQELQVNSEFVEVDNHIHTHTHTHTYTFTHTKTHTLMTFTLNILILDVDRHLTMKLN